MKRFKIFRSIPGTGLFFGVILGIFIIITINLPINGDNRDSLILALVLTFVVLSQTMIHIEGSKEKFLRLFLSSFITFCFLPLSFIIYFTMDRIGPGTQWGSLLGMGALICVILTFFILFIRNNIKGSSFALREAQVADINQIQAVRRLVKENTLSDPSLVTDADCEEYMTVRGKGWVFEADERIVGFVIADLRDHNIWALFIDPAFEDRGIGKQLHDTMLDWYFTQTQETVWLGTAPGTRAEGFYRKAGWKDAGMHGKELKFEMDLDTWKQLRSDNQ